MTLYVGITYRAHNPSWSFTPLSGEGARIHGGRFNPKGTPALYTSLSEITALAEYNQGFPHRPQPKTLCAYEVDCQDIIDLSNSHNRNQWSVSIDVLTSPWEAMMYDNVTPPSWELAVRLKAQGVNGIIVPSQANNAPEDAKNLVLWNWGAECPCKVKLIDDHHLLPKDGKSWGKE